MTNQPVSGFLPVYCYAICVDLPKLIELGEEGLLSFLKDKLTFFSKSVCSHVLIWAKQAHKNQTNVLLAVITSLVHTIHEKLSS